ncbi:hypothetical protein AB0F30_17205 [Streptomyces sp. NPDC029006]|uniref:hypothetical protein n=1 Tax=Streptomyces sp. NPDC029006 TaxID=3155467 RepID=UPI0033F0114D
MSRYKPKEGPVVPVVGGAVASSAGDREEQMRKWEAEQAQRRQAASTPAPVVAPPASTPLIPAPVSAGTDTEESALVVKPAVALPDPGASPEDQLAVCERGIHGAKARWKTKVDAATEEFITEAGPYLCWVHEHKLYKLMRDNAGKLYRSFPKYLKEQHGLTERTGYRITQTIPLLTMLRDAGYVLDDLSARQVEKLHPVRLQHGGDAVVKVFATAAETQKGTQPTPEELDKAKLLLGYATKPDPDEETKRLASATDPGTVVERAAKLLVPETVREAVRKDPEKVRHLVRVLNSALAEAGVPVD